MAIQMRRGLLADYDKNKMLGGEWGISIDETTENQKAYIAFAPGVDKEVLFVEDAEVQLEEAISKATKEAEAWAHGDSFTATDYADGDGTTTAFELEETPESIVSVIVDNVVLTSEYSVFDNVITFNEPPSAGTKNVIIQYTVDVSSDNSKYWANHAAEVGAYWINRENSIGASWVASENDTGENWIEQITDTGEYWSNETVALAKEQVEQAEAWAVGERNGVPVSATDSTYHNNSKYYRGLAKDAYVQCLAAAQDIRAYFALIRLLLSTVYLETEDSKYLITESGNRIVVDY